MGGGGGTNRGERRHLRVEGGSQIGVRGDTWGLGGGGHK